MAEWEEFTERTLEDLERWLAVGGEGRGGEGRGGEGGRIIITHYKYYSSSDLLENKYILYITTLYMYM